VHGSSSEVAGGLSTQTSVETGSGSIGSLDSGQLPKILDRVTVLIQTHHCLAIVGWILKQIHFELFITLVFIFPLIDTVCGLLVLEPLEDSLVLNSDFNKFLLTLLTVQTSNFKSLWVVELRLGVLHNVRHFLKQNSIFTLNFSKLPFLDSFLLGLASVLVVLEWRCVELLANSGPNGAQMLFVNLLVLLVPAAL